MIGKSGSEVARLPDEEVEAFFSTDGVNKRRIAFRARIEHVQKALQRRLKELSVEHVSLVERFSSRAATGATASAGDDEYSGVRDVAREITASALEDSVTEAFTALLAFTPNVDPAETWEREALLKRLSMLREQVRMLKAELRQQQGRYNTLAGSHSSLLHFTNALRTSLWSSVNAIAAELRARDDQSGALQVLAAFHREWPSDVTSQATLLEQLQAVNDRGNRTLEYSEEADDAVKELVANAVAEARGEERAKTRAVEEQLHDLEASLPTRIAEAVRIAKDSMKNNAALFERLKGEYEQRIDELSDLVETMKTEANRRVDDVRNVVLKFTKASVGIDVGRKLASGHAGDDERRIAESILKQEELKMELLRQKMENKVEQQTLHRTLKAANQRLAKVRPESDIVAEAQEPLAKEIGSLKLEVLSWNERAAALSRELQRQQQLLETTKNEHRLELQQLELLTAKSARRESVVGGNNSTFAGKAVIGFSQTHVPVGEVSRGLPTDSQQLTSQRQRTTMFLLPGEDIIASEMVPETTVASSAAAFHVGDEISHEKRIEPEAKAHDNIDYKTATGNAGHFPPKERESHSSERSIAQEKNETILVPPSGHDNEAKVCNSNGALPEATSAGQTVRTQQRSGGGNQPLRGKKELTAKPNMPATSQPARGRHVLDAMVTAAVRASGSAATVSLTGITNSATKPLQGDTKPTHSSDAWKPMDLVRVLLAAAAAQMVQRSLNMTATVVAPSHSNATKPIKFGSPTTRTVSTQTPQSRPQLPNHSLPEPVAHFGVTQSSSHGQSQSCSPRFPTRPISAIHSFPRTAPSMQRVHRRSAADIALLPESMILSKK